MDCAAHTAVSHGGDRRLERLEELIFVAFEDIALPGFQHIGIDTRAAAEYLSTRRGGQLFQRR